MDKILEEMNGFTKAAFVALMNFVMASLAMTENAAKATAAFALAYARYGDLFAGYARDLFRNKLSSSSVSIEEVDGSGEFLKAARSNCDLLIAVGDLMDKDGKPVHVGSEEYDHAVAKERVRLLSTDSKVTAFAEPIRLHGRVGTVFILKTEGWENTSVQLAGLAAFLFLLNKEDGQGSRLFEISSEKDIQSIEDGIAEVMSESANGGEQIMTETGKKLKLFQRKETMSERIGALQNASGGPLSRTLEAEAYRRQGPQVRFEYEDVPHVSVDKAGLEHLVIGPQLKRIDPDEAVQRRQLYEESIFGSDFQGAYVMNKNGLGNQFGKLMPEKHGEKFAFKFVGNIFNKLFRIMKESFFLQTQELSDTFFTTHSKWESWKLSRSFESPFGTVRLAFWSGKVFVAAKKDDFDLPHQLAYKTLTERLNASGVKIWGQQFKDALKTVRERISEKMKANGQLVWTPLQKIKEVPCGYVVFEIRGDFAARALRINRMSSLVIPPTKPIVLPPVEIGDISATLTARRKDEELMEHLKFLNAVDPEARTYRKLAKRAKARNRRKTA